MTCRYDNFRAARAAASPSFVCSHFNVIRRRVVLVGNRRPRSICYSSLFTLPAHHTVVPPQAGSAASIMLSSGPTEPDSSSSLALVHTPGLLGRGVSTRVQATDSLIAKRAVDAIVSEITRLETSLLPQDGHGEVAQWLAGTLHSPGDELLSLLVRTAFWHEETDGWFNPRIGLLTDRWRTAEHLGTEPHTDELTLLVDDLKRPAVTVLDGTPARTDATNGFAIDDLVRSFIIDRALDTVFNADGSPSAAFAATDGRVVAALVSSGGRISARGAASSRVGIVNPHRPFPDEPPLGLVSLSNQAIATSQAHRDGFRIGRTWFGPVINPFDGRPSQDTFSVTAVAPDTVAAQVIATAAAAQSPRSGLDWIDSLDGVEALIVDKNAERITTSGWQGTLNRGEN